MIRKTQIEAAIYHWPYFEIYWHKYSDEHDTNKDSFEKITKEYKHWLEFTGRNS